MTSRPGLKLLADEYFGLTLFEHSVTGHGDQGDSHQAAINISDLCHKKTFHIH